MNLFSLSGRQAFNKKAFKKLFFCVRQNQLFSLHRIRLWVSHFPFLPGAQIFLLITKFRRKCRIKFIPSKKPHQSKSNYGMAMEMEKTINTIVSQSESSLQSFILFHHRQAPDGIKFSWKFFQSWFAPLLDLHRHSHHRSDTMEKRFSEKQWSRHRMDGGR